MIRVQWSYVEKKEGTGPNRLPRYHGDHTTCYAVTVLLGGPSENRYRKNKIAQEIILATHLIFSTLINEVECL